MEFLACFQVWATIAQHTVCIYSFSFKWVIISLELVFINKMKTGFKVVRIINSLEILLDFLQKNSKIKFLYNENQFLRICIE